MGLVSNFWLVFQYCSLRSRANIRVIVRYRSRNSRVLRTNFETLPLNPPSKLVRAHGQPQVGGSTLHPPAKGKTEGRRPAWEQKIDLLNFREFPPPTPPSIPIGLVSNFWLVVQNYTLGSRANIRVIVRYRSRNLGS